MDNGSFAVVVQEGGKQAKAVIVGNGATVRTALRAIKLDPEKYNGQVTLNGKAAGLGDRLSQKTLLAITPNTAGGR